MRPTFLSTEYLVVDVLPGTLPDAAGDVDVIVSSDDNYLSHGGGVSAAIWKAAGAELKKYVDVHPPRLGLGDVLATPAGRLAAKQLLHAVTIDFDAGKSIGAEDCSRLYAKVFDEAAAAGHASLATPLLGGGAARLSEEESISSFVRAISGRIDEKTALTRIVLVLEPKIFRARESLIRRSLSMIEPLESLEEELKGCWGEYLSRVPLTDADDKPLNRAVQWIDLCRRHLGGGNLIEHETAQARLWVANDASNETATAKKWEWSNRNLSDLQRGISARNRAVRAPILNRDESRALLEEMKRSIRSFLSDEMTLFIDFDREDVDTISSTVLIEPELQDPPPTVSENDPVRRLQRLLVDTLDEKDRDHLIASLLKEGYRGEPLACLLEYCVRADPFEICRRWLNPRLVDHVLDQLPGRQLPEALPFEAKVRSLVERIGFPRHENIVSLRALRRDMASAKSAIPHADIVQLRGIVVDAGALLEFACRVLMHFMAKRVFNLSAEGYAIQHKLVKKPLELGTWSLGSWIRGLAHLSQQIQSSTIPAASDFREEFGTVGIVPPNATAMAGARNAFVHYRESIKTDSLPKARLTAREFFESAGELIEQWSTHPAQLYPIVLRIKEIRIDEWGRRIVIGVDDDGRPEYIFSDIPLLPGQVYLMHPLTNPFRIDPILVAAGDLLSTRQTT